MMSDADSAGAMSAVSGSASSLARSLVTRRRAFVGLAAVAAGLWWRGPAAAAEPLAASLTARKVTGNQVRTTVKAQVALPGLNWSGTLGTWDVPEGGSRQVSVQPPGVPAKFDIVLTMAQRRMEMRMTMMRGTAYGGPWGPGYGYNTSAPIV